MTNLHPGVPFAASHSLYGVYQSNASWVLEAVEKLLFLFQLLYHKWDKFKTTELRPPTFSYVHLFTM